MMYSILAYSVNRPSLILITKCWIRHSNIIRTNNYIFNGLKRRLVGMMFEYLSFKDLRVVFQGKEDIFNFLLKTTNIICWTFIFWYVKEEGKKETWHKQCFLVYSITCNSNLVKIKVLKVRFLWALKAKGRTFPMRGDRLKGSGKFPYRSPVIFIWLSLSSMVISKEEILSQSWGNLNEKNMLVILGPQYLI